MSKEASGDARDAKKVLDKEIEEHN